jgi:hypothetical protein
VRRLRWPTVEQAALAVYLLCFGYGALTHAYDFVRYGWWPYRFGPPAANLFWNALLLLDAAVVALLLLGRRRVGLALALVVIAADVAINFYAWRVLGFDGFAVAVPVQALVLGFVLGSIAFLWRRPLRKEVRA